MLDRLKFKKVQLEKENPFGASRRRASRRVRLPGGYLADVWQHNSPTLGPYIIYVDPPGSRRSMSRARVIREWSRLQPLEAMCLLSLLVERGHQFDAECIDTHDDEGRQCNCMS